MRKRTDDPVYCRCPVMLVVGDNAPAEEGVVSMKCNTASYTAVGSNMRLCLCVGLLEDRIVIANCEG